MENKQNKGGGMERTAGAADRASGAGQPAGGGTAGAEASG